MIQLGLVGVLSAAAAQAQWQMQTSNSTADLRGIDAVGGGVAWASGAHGTVLRTEDGGYMWQSCSMPPGAEDLDFRGVQAFDADTALVMSSGPGNGSRVYKTLDGCHSWKLVLSNPDSPDGFFDAMLFLDRQHGILFGDPAPTDPQTGFTGGGNFRMRLTRDGGATWIPVDQADEKSGPLGLHAAPQEGAFAASNSSIASGDGMFWFATSASRVDARRLFAGKHVPKTLFDVAVCGRFVDPALRSCGLPWVEYRDSNVPIAHASASMGIFSIAFRTSNVGIAVGGDYKNPEGSVQNAAYSEDGGVTWHAAQTMPHGYRSSVAYEAALKRWITVGPNGTDISTDDGESWHAMKPNAALHEMPDADRDWNAISLPYVVGPHGRIGRLDAPPHPLGQAKN